MKTAEFKEGVNDYLKDVLGLIGKIEHHKSSSGNYDLLITPYAPYPGVTVFTTIGLMDHISRKEGGFNLYCEVIAVAYTEFLKYKECVNSIVCELLKNPNKLHEFSLITGVFKNTDIGMSSIFLTHPFIFDGKLDYFNKEDHGVGWLMAIPITEKEETFLQFNGTEALETLFEEHQVDIFNLNRPSVV